MASNFDERVRLGLIRNYSLDELKDLCQDLKVNYETLKHDTLNNLARELIRYMARRNRLPELIKRLRRQRPNYIWPDAPPTPSAGPRSAKLAAYLGGSHLPKAPVGRAKNPSTRSSTRSHHRSARSRPGYDPRLIRFGLIILFAVVSTVGIWLALGDNNRPAIGSEQPRIEQPGATLSPDRADNSTIQTSWGWGIVNDTAFSPDGRLVAVASTYRVMFYDATSLDYREDYTTESAAVSVAFSRDGRKLAAGLVGGRVVVWSLDGGDKLGEKQVHTSDVSDLVFMPDGDNLLIGFSDGSVRMWSLTGGEPIVLAEGIGSVNGVAVSPNGLTLGAVGADGNIRLWDAPFTAPPRLWTGHPEAIIRAVAFAPDGARLATAGDDGVGNVWSTIDGSRLATTPMTSESIHAIAYSPDGASLALGYDEGSVRLWPPVDGAGLTPLGNTEHPPHAGAVRAVAFAPGGDTLLTASSNDTVRLWRAEDGQFLHETPHFLGWVYDVEFAPDGSYVAAALSSTYVERPTLTEGTARNRLAGHTAAVRSLAFAPNGLTLATGGADNTVRLWQSATGELLYTMTGHTDIVNSVAFAPNGATVASGSSDGTVRLWRVADGVLAATLPGQASPIWSVAFSPDGTRLAAGLENGSILVWSLPDGSLVRIVRYEQTAAVRGVAFSPDGATLVSVWDGGSADLWPMPDGPRRQLLAPGMRMTSVAFSPDGQMLAVGIDDRAGGGHVGLLSVANGTLLKDLAPHRGAVTSVAFSNDGTALASGAMDGILRVWGVAAATQP